MNLIKHCFAKAFRHMRSNYILCNSIYMMSKKMEKSLADCGSQKNFH